MSKTTQALQDIVPRHVAIIMDGNNRWAKKRFLPGVAGHKAGVDAVRAVIEVCAEAGVEVLTLFAFSSENWQRPEAEVGALMELFLVALRRESKKLDQNGIRLRGLVRAYSNGIQQLVPQMETIEKRFYQRYQLHCDYAQMALIESLLATTFGRIVQVEYLQSVNALIEVDQQLSEQFIEQLNSLTQGKVFAKKIPLNVSRNGIIT